MNKRKFEGEPETLGEVLEHVIETEEPGAKRSRTAPTVREVKAYWGQGREGQEAFTMMEKYKTKDAVTGTDIYYIPERDPETLEELPAPTDLTGQVYGDEEG